MAEKKKPLRWRRVTFRVFVRREHRHELRRGEEVLANVRHASAGWYWTARDSMTPNYAGSEAECKAAALAHVRASEVG